MMVPDASRHSARSKRPKKLKGYFWRASYLLRIGYADCSTGCAKVNEEFFLLRRWWLVCASKFFGSPRANEKVRATTNATNWDKLGN